MRRTLVMLVLTLTLAVIPAAAQRRVVVPDITRYAEFAPATAVIYAAIRTDTGYIEQTNALLDRLEPLIGETEFDDLFYGIFNSEDLASFLGDGIALTVLTSEADLGDLFEDESPVAITFGLKDMAAAQAFLESTSDMRPVERGGWIVYEEDSARALLRGDVMLISPDMAFTDQLISGDYGKLSADEDFIATLDRLPTENYDFLAYADLETITGSMTARADRASNDATAGLLGHVAVGGLNVGGRDLLLDAAWRYGDLEAIREYGFTPESLTASAADMDFARRLPADTQFYLQATGFGGTLAETFNLLNVFGKLMENDASTEFFGLDGILNATTGDTAKAAATFALAAATGLNLQTDVIDTLRGDFALYAGIVPVPQPVEYLPAGGILLTESGQGERFTGAFVNSLDRAGYRINRIPLRGIGEAIDLSPFTDPFMAGIFGVEAGTNPNVDFWFGAANGVMALGTAPGVQFALSPQAESLAATPEFQHVVESTFLDGALAIAYINVGGLAGVADMPELTDRVESLSASARGDLEGLVVRFAVTLK